MYYLKIKKKFLTKKLYYKLKKMEKNRTGMTNDGAVIFFFSFYI